MEKLPIGLEHATPSSTKAGTTNAQVQGAEKEYELNTATNLQKLLNTIQIRRAGNTEFLVTNTPCLVTLHVSLPGTSPMDRDNEIY